MVTIKEELIEYNKEVDELMLEASRLNTKFRFDINTFFAWRASKNEIRSKISNEYK